MPMVQEEREPNVQRRPRKRSRIPLACDTCRERKVKCNGAKPICGNCLRRGSNVRQCVYSTVVNPRRDDSQREYIKTLHDRIRHLEASVAPQNAEENISNGMDTLDHSEGHHFDDEQHHFSKQSQHQGPPPQRQYSTKAVPQANPPPVRRDGQTSSSPLGPVFSGHLRNRSSNIDVHKSPLAIESVSQVGMNIVTPGISQCGTNEGTASQSTGQDSSSSIDDESQISAMGTICSVQPLPHSPLESCYGQSSVVSLQNQIRCSPAEQNRPDRTTPLEQGLNRSSRPTISSLSKIWAFSLPPRRIADQLLEQYWAGVNLFYPWIHAPSFLAAYRRLWVSGDTDADNRGKLQRVGLGGSDCSLPVFHCALNVIFALGCEFSTTITDPREHPATEFMDRVYELLQVRLLDEGGLAMVQTLLLLSIYLQSTQRPMQCWGMIGLAYRMAQSIGLQLEHSQSGYSTLEIEMRRRAWHGCAHLDRIVSMTLGRLPSRLEGREIPLFSAVDDEYLGSSSEPCVQPDNMPSRTAFAVENVKLGRIVGQLLHHLYWKKGEETALDLPWSLPANKPSHFDVIVALDSSLSDFEASLPSILRWKDEETDYDQISKPFLRQRYVLRARTLHVRLMLFRPSFSNICSSPTTGKSKAVESGIGTIFESRCAVTCFEAASKLICLLNKAIFEEMFGAWWYALFYLMTASVILILAETSPNMRTYLDEPDFIRLWETSHKTLDLINLRHAMAGQCAFALKRLRERAVRVSQKTTSSGGAQPNTTQNATGNHLQNVQGQSSQSLGQLYSLSDHWNFEAPCQDAFSVLDGMDLQGFSDPDAELFPLMQNLQNTFGGALLPEAI